MNEISRLKLENEELFKSVNLLNDKVGKVKYHKAENYYLSAPCSLYSYESKGESMAITSGKIEKTSENCCVSLYIDGVFVDKKECAQDGSFLFVYYLPQSKSSTVSLTCSEENAQIISVRTFIAGNVVVYYTQTAKACSTENGTVYARVKNGQLNLKTVDGQSVFFDECSCFDIAKSEQGITQIVQNANDKLVLSVVENGTVINQNLYTFLNGEERLLQDLCATYFDDKIIVVCIVENKMRYYCFNANTLLKESEGEILAKIKPFSVCFMKNAPSPILIANASDKNYMIKWSE